MNMLVNTSPNGDTDSAKQNRQQRLVTWKRILLLIVAITIHNIPGNYNK